MLKQFFVQTFWVKYAPSMVCCNLSEAAPIACFVHFVFWNLHSVFLKNTFEKVDFEKSA